MGKNNAIKLSAAELLEKNHIDPVKKAGDFSSYSFWYYTNIETASSILNSRSFWLRNLQSMNDRSEVRDQRELADKVHALCLCNSNSEKIPMWYLYAGLSGKGVAIGVTPSGMLELLRSIEKVNVGTAEKPEYLQRG